MGAEIVRDVFPEADELWLIYFFVCFKRVSVVHSRGNGVVFGIGGANGTAQREGTDMIVLFIIP